MKILQNITVLIIISLTLVSCHEWDPVLKGKWEDVPKEDIVKLEPNITINELKKLYTAGQPYHIEKEYIIGGQVTTSDQAGNVYRSIYIQDQTGGIEVKIGKTGLYNEYKLGQWVYIKLEGLTLGAYEGMLQIGLEDPTGEYETAYIDLQYIINQHVFKGEIGSPVSPIILTDTDLMKEENMGKYVTLENLRYGNQIFCLIYPDQMGDKKSSSNRVFLDEKTWGITTWAMSQKKMQQYAESGIWDSAKTADDAKTVKELRENGELEYAATYVSQYFILGNYAIQVRTSGYSKFADDEIDPDVLSGNKSITLSGILSNYRGDPQFTIIDSQGIKVNNQ